MCVYLSPAVPSPGQGGTCAVQARPAFFPCRPSLLAVGSRQPEAVQPHPDHVKSQRPRRGVVPLQMNDINSWKCFQKGVFPLRVSASLKNTGLEVNSLCCCKGANKDFLPHPWL